MHGKRKRICIVVALVVVQKVIGNLHLTDKELYKTWTNIHFCITVLFFFCLFIFLYYHLFSSLTLSYCVTIFTTVPAGNGGYVPFKLVKPFVGVCNIHTNMVAVALMNSLDILTNWRL